MPNASKGVRSTPNSGDGYFQAQGTNRGHDGSRLPALPELSRAHVCGAAGTVAPTASSSGSAQRIGPPLSTSTFRRTIARQTASEVTSLKIPFN